MGRAACSLNVLPNTSLQSFDVLVVSFLSPMLFTLTGRLQLHLLWSFTPPALPGNLSILNPTPYFSRDCLEPSSLIPLVKIFILQKTSHFLRGHYLCNYFLSIEIFPPMKRTKFKRPRNPTKLTRLSNFGYQMSCDYRISLLKNNANFGFRVWTKTPNMGLPSGSERVTRLMGKCPNSRDCYLTVGMSQRGHGGPNP